MEFDVRDLIAPLEPIWDTTVIPYTLEGNFLDARPFSIDGTVTVVGHLTGDINNDGSGPDISDLMYLIDFMFSDGPRPAIVGVEDVDHSGVHDIADLLTLVNLVF